MNPGTLGFVGGEPFSSVVVGTSVIYNDVGGTMLHKVVALDSTTAIEICRLSSGTYDVYGTVVTISGMTATVGNEQLLASDNLAGMVIRRLTDNKALLLYRVSGELLIAPLYKVDGELILGDGVAVIGLAVEGDFAVMSETTGVAVFPDGSSYVNVRTFLVTGATVSYPNTSVAINSSSSEYVSIDVLSTTRAIVCYQDEGNSDYGTCQCITLNGTATPTYTSAVVFESSATLYTSITALTDGYAIVAYVDSGDSSKGKVCLLSLSGTTITPGTPITFNDASTLSPSIIKISATRAVVSYQDTGDSSKGKVCVISLTDGQITAGDEFTFATGTTNYSAIDAVTSSKAIVAYRDDDDNDYGKTCVIQIN